jgi:hypothetical protein
VSVLRFEVLNALRDLDERSEPFLVQEAITGGDLTARMQAIMALTAPPGRSARVLRAILGAITSNDD